MTVAVLIACAVIAVIMLIVMIYACLVLSGRKLYQDHGTAFFFSPFFLEPSY